MNGLQLFAYLAVASIALLTAACSTPPSASGNPRAALERGACPAGIIDAAGRDSEGLQRYPGVVNPGQLAQYRRREIANCQTLLAAGDNSALTTLASHYQNSGPESALVQLLENYTAAGRNRERLREAASHLHRVYASDSGDVAADRDKALRYLALAVANGASALRINYARALADQGRYRAAREQFEQVLLAPQDHPGLDQCEARLGLAHLYFGRDPALENWNLGYYFWRDGLAMARGDRWGSCVEDNFTSAHYREESARLKIAQARIALMPAARRQVIDAARLDPARGLEFVAALSFQAPVRVKAPSAPADHQASWRPWRPLNAPLCRRQNAAAPVPWSEVFARSEAAIWAVESGNSRGSAVAASPRELLTNCHLLSDPGSITLRRPGLRLQAAVQAADRKGDRCVLQVASDLPSHLDRGRGLASLKIGEDVAAIGNPRGLEGSLSRGIVGQKRSRDGLGLIQTDAAIAAGSSGGGLFDRSGSLVGITTFTVAEGRGLNFAIALDEYCR